MKFIPLFRSLSHGMSYKKIIERTPDDNAEASEYTDEKFRNRKGGTRNIPDLYDDKQPEYNKFPVKPKDGTRMLKGAKTIRRGLRRETDIIEDSDVL